MEPTGIILACVDTDAAALESWHRWYDVEHLPPNIALDGIMTGRRYVAPPELHDARLPAQPLDGFAGGHGTNLTIYTLCGDPAQVIADMTSERDVLEAAGRMDGAGNRVVRFGDAMTLTWGVAAAELRADERDVPFIGHEAVRVVLRRGAAVDCRSTGGAAAAVAGVHAVNGYDAVYLAGTACDLYLLEGDPVAVTDAVRTDAPYPTDTDVLLDATFAVVTPFDYSFADRIRASSMPQTID